MPLRGGERNLQISTMDRRLSHSCLLKVQGKPVSAGTEQAVKAVSAFIGKLAVLYREDKEGT